MTLRSLLVDFNSYFASVEQQVEPRLRGKPLGVVPMLADTTVCIAASVEAKTYGLVDEVIKSRKEVKLLDGANAPGADRAAAVAEAALPRKVGE